MERMPNPAWFMYDTRSRWAAAKISSRNRADSGFKSWLSPLSTFFAANQQKLFSPQSSCLSIFWGVLDLSYHMNATLYLAGLPSACPWRLSEPAQAVISNPSIPISFSWRIKSQKSIVEGLEQASNQRPVTVYKGGRYLESITQVQVIWPQGHFGAMWYNTSCTTEFLTQATKWGSQSCIKVSRAFR